MRRTSFATITRKCGMSGNADRTRVTAAAKVIPTCGKRVKNAAIMPQGAAKEKCNEREEKDSKYKKSGSTGLSI